MISQISIILCILLSHVAPINELDKVCISSEEKQLHELLNQYRKEKDLPYIPLSEALTKVAQAHVKDLMENYEMNDKCNMHSWSKKGEWTSCCYTSDHKEAECMWNKPSEIADYQSPGFEIAHWHSAQATPQSAIEGWKKSSGHNQVMINLGIWKSSEWKGVGVAIYQQYAVIWFGELSDEASSPQVCN